MTADDLLEDLARLLREGLVYVDEDPYSIEEEPVPRFALTAKGLAESSDNGLFRERPVLVPGVTHDIDGEAW